MAAEELINVLCVDDDVSIVEMIKMGLENDGMHVLSAGDGAEALEVLAAEPVDVILLDIMMPRVDGWMALMEIRNNPLTADIPVIMLTAKTQDLAKILAFKQGVQQYVTKPFNLMELSARVRSLTRNRPRAAIGGPGGESDFRKLAVRKGGRTVLLNLDDIVYISAKNKSTYVHTYENQYLVDLTLTELEAKFLKETFERVHRSYMVNLNKVKEILRVDGAYVVVVTDRDETQIPVARRQVRDFRGSVGI
ncbi:MAG: LytTR family DNA-binding domain-containing protein [Actinomycetota bacterium]|nr:MAG: two-component system LytT family response regulator [Actinomycetota bacterium]MDO8950271.1 LytTR family DNA-binding domain-containing protein [Actinomycetota bacterium]MDP3630763.1 LytTR family DNA-binding domain-containing protein [Actinomycetota bacterium]